LLIVFLKALFGKANEHCRWCFALDDTFLSLLGFWRIGFLIEWRSKFAGGSIDE